MQVVFLCRVKFYATLHISSIELIQKASAGGSLTPQERTFLAVSSARLRSFSPEWR